MERSHTHKKWQRQKVAAARLSIGANTLLMLGKVIGGMMAGSVSVLSDAIDSAVDMLASWIAYLSVRVSDRPADEEHPYGHGKVESLSGMAEAMLIFGAAGYIIYEAIQKLITRSGPHHVDIGIGVMIGSLVVNSLLARYLFRVAHQTDSPALKADAEHFRTNLYQSMGVLLGLLLVRLTGIRLIDPIVAMVVAVLIVRAAWQLFHDSLAPLIDTRLPEHELEVVRRVLESEPEVLGYHKLRTRKSGSSRHVDAHVQMDDNLTLLHAHELTERLEDRIRTELPNVEITLHTEPYHAEQHHQFEFHGGPKPEENRSGSDNQKDASPVDRNR
ncbi:MAG TPA: cation diffusion facilitator family transporter [Chthonomonadales bacterium]|nr:cation diffusion facilitator family transporter [Chthonomonadales bacterium]